MSNFSTNDAKQLFDDASYRELCEAVDETTTVVDPALIVDPFCDELTVTFPEDTSRVMRAVTKECSELSCRGYSDATLEHSAVFVIEHGSGIQPIQLKSARYRALVRPDREERVVERKGRRHKIRICKGS